MMGIRCVPRVYFQCLVLVFLLVLLVVLTFLYCEHEESRLSSRKEYNSVVENMKAPANAVSGNLFQSMRVRVFKHELRYADGISEQNDDHYSPAKPILFGKRWAVCTTVRKATVAILFFTQREDWNLVIVGDESMDTDFHISGGDSVVYLDAKEQARLDGVFAAHRALVDLLPWRHFGRKNVGYLYAIMHGAELVWDFDDDNFLKTGLEPVVPKEGIVDVIPQEKDGCPSFNPLQFMGGDMTGITPMWPRGYPLDKIKTTCSVSFVAGTKPERIAIFQSLADHEPDVDGIYRVTRLTPYNFTSRRHVQTLKIPSGQVMSPYNAQATLVTKDALWSLLLPVTVHGRVSDIWRGYFSQRLFWDLDLSVAFTPPIVNQFRNAHNPLADMQAELDLYFKTPELIRHLREWNGSAHKSLPGRIEELAVSLYEHDFWGERDVLLYQEWIAALLRIGYRFPVPHEQHWRLRGAGQPAKSRTLSTKRFAGPESEEALSPASARLGPWQPFFDPSMLPLAWGNARTQQVILSHELNLDFGEVLYLEDNWLVFVDAAGPVCLTQAFFAANKATAATDDGQERFMIDIDGQLLLNKSTADIFYRGVPELPRPLTRATVQDQIMDGWYATGMLCARRRFRMGMRWMNTDAPMLDIMRQGEACVKSVQVQVQCPSTLYYNVQLLHIPLNAFPSHWHPPVPGRAPFDSRDIEASGLQVSSLDEAVDALRLIRRFLNSSLAAIKSFDVTIGPDNRSEIVWSTEKAGVVRLLLIDTVMGGSERRVALHRSDVLLKAWWDGGVSSVAGVGWPDSYPRSSPCNGGIEPSLSVSLASLWGPLKMFDADLPAHPTLLLGETDEYGLHVAFPMPFWESACIGLEFTGPADQESIVFRVTVVAEETQVGAQHSYPADGTAGYFFVFQESRKLQEGLYSPSNYLINVTGLRGSLVGLLQFASSATQFFVEGDLLLWVDGCPSPAIWSSGYEDFFLGSHGYYVRDFNGPFHAYHRQDSPSGLETWQMRHLTADAIPFRDSLVGLVEGEGYAPDMVEPNTFISSTALVYGWPTRGLVLTDELVPGDEVDAAGTSSPHRYFIDLGKGGKAGAGLTEYALATHIPSYGLDRSQHPPGRRIPSETFLVVARVLALEARASVSFRVGVDPDNVGVILRRLVDVRRPVSRADVTVDGEPAGTWFSADRSWSHLDGHWQVQDFIVDEAQTHGKSYLDVVLDAGPDTTTPGRIPYDFLLAPAWVEARWWIISILPNWGFGSAVPVSFR